MSLWRDLERLALYSVNRSIARSERVARERRAARAMMERAHALGGEFLQWAKAHPDHPLTQRVEAEIAEVYSNLRLDENARLKKLSTIYVNAHRLAIEADEQARVKAKQKAQQVVADEAKQFFDLVSQAGGVSAEAFNGQWQDSEEKLELAIELQEQVIAKLADYQRQCPNPVIDEAKAWFEAGCNGLAARLAWVHNPTPENWQAAEKACQEFVTERSQLNVQALSDHHHFCESGRSTASTDRLATGHDATTGSAANRMRCCLSGDSVNRYGLGHW